MANNVVSTGRIELLDLNDSKQMHMFISSSQPKTQIYSRDSGKYMPNWSLNNPVLTPQLYLAGTSVDLIDGAKSITWYEGSGRNPITNDDNSFTIRESGKTLAINDNILTNKSLRFNGDDTRVAIANNDEMDDLNQVTVEMKVNPSSLGSFDQDLIFKGAHNAQSPFGLWIDQGNTPNNIAFLITSSSFSGVKYTNTTLEVNKEVHITAVYDGIKGEMRIYFNGVEDANSPFSAPTGKIKSETSSWSIGSSTNGAHFNGSIREVRFWKTVRTQQEIIDNMNKEVVAEDDNLVGYWKLYDGIGDIAHDSSNSKNDGSIKGGLTWGGEDVGFKTISCEVIYTDPDTGFDVSSRADIEFQKVLTGVKGDKGDKGTTRVMSSLSNTYHLIPTDIDGNNGNYNNAITEMSIFVGTKDDTSNWSITASPSSGVTGSLNSNTYSITNLSGDSGTVTLTATKSGYSSISQTFTVAKSKRGKKGGKGDTGGSAIEYWLTNKARAIKKDIDGNFIPSVVTFNAKYKNGNSSPSNYNGRFIIAESTNGTSFTNVYTSSSNESSASYTPSKNAQIVRVRLYMSGGTTTMIDEQIIPIVYDGATGAKGSSALANIVWAPNGNIIKNGKGQVVAQSDLHSGGDIIEADNYRWYRQNPNATSEGGVGWETLDVGNENLFEGGTLEKHVGSREHMYYANIHHALEKAGVGTEITISFDVEMDKGDFLQVYNQNHRGRLSFYPNKIFRDIGTSKKRLSFVATVEKTLEEDVRRDEGDIEFYSRYDTGDFFTISNLKIEVGNRATAYRPHSSAEDIDPNDNNMYGRNLITNSEKRFDISVTKGKVSYEVVQDDSVENGVSHKFSITNLDSNNDASLYVIPEYSDEFNNNDGNTYTLTFKMKANRNLTNRVRSEVVNGTIVADLTTEYQTFRLTALNDIRYRAIYFIRAESSLRVGDVIYVSDVKLEKGEIATDYAPAPEDNSENYPTAENGKNSWIFEFYDNGNNNAPDYRKLKSLIPTYKTVISDSSVFSSRIGDNYYSYTRTAVYVKSDTIIETSIKHDNGSNIYINGIAQYVGLTLEQSFIPLSLKLKKGWNSIEITLGEGTGGDYVEIGDEISLLVDEMNCYYALPYGQLKGVDGIEGFNTDRITISADAVVGLEGFKCITDYNGQSLEDIITVNDVSDPYHIAIIGTSTFKNGQGQSAFTARLFRNGEEVDANNDSGLTYKWYIYNSDDTLNSSFSKTGKTITVEASDITNEGRLVCEVDV